MNPQKDNPSVPPQKTRKVVIFGNASPAQVLFMELTHDSDFEVVGFTVDKAFIEQDELFGLPVVPFEKVSSVFPPVLHRMMVAVGYSQVNRLRADRCQAAREMGYQLVSYVSSRAALWPDLKLGENCQIGSLTAIQAFVEIGDNVVIGDGVVIGHHAVIEDHCFIAAGVRIAGGTKIGRSSIIGTGAVVRNRIVIAPGCVIGAGAVILSDTRERGVYHAAPVEELPIKSDQLSL